MRSKTKSKAQITSVTNTNGNTTDSTDEIVSVFNDYFTSVFTAEDTTSLPVPMSMTGNYNIEDINFDEQDILKLLSRLRADKAAGADDLTPRFLLYIKHNISYPLYLLFRKSLDEGDIPENWRCANISPIFKKGNRNHAENYRPVSLTSQVCKIFEVVIRDGIVHHEESNMLINNSQHGFRKGSSCLTNNIFGQSCWMLGYWG